MVSLKNRLLISGALIAFPATAVMAQDAPPGAPQAMPNAASSNAPEAAPAAPGRTDADAAGTPASGDIIVTARRSNERLQNVPISVSVLAPATLNSKGTFTPTDLTKDVPGLSVAASIGDRNNVTYSIRGQGFAYGTLFPAVITYFDEVPITQLTAGQFFDLANVQVLRGPQGVNFGRVTDGGNVMVTAQEPKNEFGGYAQVKLGDYNAKIFDGALNVPIVEDKVLLRGAFEIGRRDGFTTNLYNGQDLDDQRYESYRVGLKLNLTDTLTNTTTVSYQHTHDNGTADVLAAVNDPVLAAQVGGVAGLFPGVYGIDGNGTVHPFAPGLTPYTAASYITEINRELANQQALGPRKVFQTYPSFDNRKNLYVVNRTVAQLSDALTLTNIFGYIDVRDDEASSFSGDNLGTVETCHSACGTPGSGLLFNSQKQYSEELRLSGKSFNNHLTWAIGGYADKQDPGGRQFENDTLTFSILERDGVQYSTTTSKALYASGEYDLEQLLPGLKVNGGVRYTHDTVDTVEATYLRPVAGTPAQLATVLTGILPLEGVPAAFVPATAAGIAAATYAPIPHGACTSYGTVGGFPSLFGAASCNHITQAFNATTWQAGLSYKRGAGPLLYFKASKGYRPGGVNATAPAGTSPVYNPEYDTSFEIGIKSQFHLGSTTVRANLAAYHDDYSKIQKGIVVPGAVPLQLVRNVDDATVQGIEFDGAIIPFRSLTIGGSFAYTDAKFDKNVSYDPIACNPAGATTNASFCPFNRFAYTPKFQYTLTADYTLPLDPGMGKVVVGAQWYHQSSIALNDTSTLNPLAVERPYGLLDLNVSWTNVYGKPFDLGFFMTNALNRLYRIGSNDLTQASSVGTASNIYGAPRMFGFSLKYRFGSDAR
ncbi:MAG: TonB-dependent receptor plug domain-containing protein [Sphingomonadaceae bacterium]|nr:TonB-dependent receptor plug domain-containing protein [Sphingomonadaceae bacterium]